MKNNKRYLRAIFHGFGIGCTFGSILTAVITFTHIMIYGYFKAYEPIIPVLYTETAMMYYAFIYWSYMVWKLIKT